MKLLPIVIDFISGTAGRIYSRKTRASIADEQAALNYRSRCEKTRHNTEIFPFLRGFLRLLKGHSFVIYLYAQELFLMLYR